MKITARIVALVLFAAGITAAVHANDYTLATSVPLTEAVIPVNAELPQPTTIEVAPVIITAKAPIQAPRPRKVATRQTGQCGAFAARPLTQGSGSVRGFCTN